MKAKQVCDALLNTALFAAPWGARYASEHIANVSFAVVWLMAIIMAVIILGMLVGPGHFPAPNENREAASFGLAAINLAATGFWIPAGLSAGVLTMILIMRTEREPANGE